MSALEDQKARVEEAQEAAKHAEDLRHKAEDDLQRHGNAMVRMGVGR